MGDSPQSAVLRFLREVEEAAGGTAPRLAAILQPALGYRPRDKTINAWLRGDRSPSAAILVAMVRALHAEGVSFDRVALQDADRRPLVDQVDELRGLVVALHELVNADRLQRGLPAADLPLPVGAP